MTPKKKDSPELFEVFRSAVRDREEGGEDLEAVSSAERESLVAEAHETAPREEVPSPAEPNPPSGMGERRLSLKYNSVVLGLMSVVGLVFVSFAMGVRWGEDRATQRKPVTVPQEESTKLAKHLEPLGVPPEQPETPMGEAVSDPGMSAAGPQAPEPRQPEPQPQPPAGKYWVRLIDFNADEATAAGLVSTHLKKLAREGFAQACERIRKDGRGIRVRSVCFGPLQTRAQALEMLPKLQAVNQKAFKQADVICDE